MLSDGPVLDRSDDERWVGTFPGLGSVEVDAAGRVSVRVDPDSDEDPALRERALREGWGDLLSLARRGVTLAWGAAAAPADDGPCALVTGDVTDQSLVLLGLSRAGWTVLADRLTPVTWEGAELHAHPRGGALLLPSRRLRALGVEGVRVRADTDSCEVQLPRRVEPSRVTALVQLRTRRVDDAPFEELVGHRRFAAAVGLLLTGGALRPWEPAAEADEGDDVSVRAAEGLSTSLRLAALPMARLAFDTATLDDDCARLITWWESVSGVPA